MASTTAATAPPPPPTPQAQPQPQGQAQLQGQAQTKSNPNSQIKTSALLNYDSSLKVTEAVINELLLICSVIGSTNENGEFIPVTDCLNWLQDLQRALRRDDDATRTIALLLGSWQVVQKKLLPIVLASRFDAALVLTSVKLLVILTQPMSESACKAARLVVDVKRAKSRKLVLTEEYKRNHNMLKKNACDQARRLVEYKKAFIDRKNAGVLKIIVSLLLEPLARNGSARTEEDHMVIELVLHLLRNLLSAGMNGGVEEGQLHEQMILLFESELVLDILVVIGQDIEARENRHYNLLIMEILSSLFANQDAELVAMQDRNDAVSTSALSPKTHLNRQHSKQNQHSNHRVDRKSKATLPRRRSNNYTTNGISLKSMLKSEQSRRQKNMNLPTRHGNFGGTLVSTRANGTKQVTSMIAKTSTTISKKERKSNKRHVTFKVDATSKTVRYSLDTKRARKVLHDFCIIFVSKCYGPLMTSLKNEFRRDSARLEQQDKLRYYALVSFFIKWHKTFDPSTIGKLIFTLDAFSFNLVLLTCEHAMDQMKTVPSKVAELEGALHLYTQMMQMVYIMTTSSDGTYNAMALGLMERLFYSREPINRIAKLFKCFKPATFAKQFACDLVELLHVSLKVLDFFDSSTAKSDSTAVRKSNDRLTMMKEAARSFDVDDFLRRLFHHTNIRLYSKLLAQYDTNTHQVNHYVVSFFIRMCKMVIATVPSSTDASLPQKVTLEPMLYTIPFLSTLRKILNDRGIRDDKHYKQIISFATTIVRHFAVECTQSNPMLIVEALFVSKLKGHCVSVMSRYMYDDEELVAMVEGERARRVKEAELNNYNNQDDDLNEEVNLQSMNQAEANNKPGSNRGSNERMNDDESEDEWVSDDENEDEIDNDNDTSEKFKKKGDVNSSSSDQKKKVKWSEEEDNILRSTLANALSVKSAIYSLIKPSSGLKKRNRSKKKIKKRMKHLGLNEAGGLTKDTDGDDEELQTSNVSDPNSNSIKAKSFVGDDRSSSHIDAESTQSTNASIFDQEDPNEKDSDDIREAEKRKSALSKLGEDVNNDEDDDNSSPSKKRRFSINTYESSQGLVLDESQPKGKAEPEELVLDKSQTNTIASPEVLSRSDEDEKSLESGISIIARSKGNKKTLVFDESDDE